MGIFLLKAYNLLPNDIIGYFEGAKMTKILEIEECKYCYYVSEYDSTAYCHHPKSPRLSVGYNKILSYPQIPLWCPLENKKENIFRGSHGEPQ